MKIAHVSPALTTAATRENVRLDFVCARRATWETSVLQVGAFNQISSKILQKKNLFMVLNSLINYF